MSVDYLMLDVARFSLERLETLHESTLCIDAERWIANVAQVFEVLELANTQLRRLAATDPAAPLAEIIASVRSLYASWASRTEAGLVECHRLESEFGPLRAKTELLVLLNASRVRGIEPWEISADWVGPASEEARNLDSADWGDASAEFIAGSRAVFHQNAPLLERLS